MRLLYTLLLSLGWLAVSLATNAADIPAKQLKVVNEYKTAQTIIPNALNDCQDITFLQGARINSSYKTNDYNYPGFDKSHCLTVYILNGALKSIYLLSPPVHAKTLIAKLIFPQHYFW